MLHVPMTFVRCDCELLGDSDHQECYVSTANRGNYISSLCSLNDPAKPYVNVSIDENPK